LKPRRNSLPSGNANAQRNFEKSLHTRHPTVKHRIVVFRQPEFSPTVALIHMSDSKEAWRQKQQEEQEEEDEELDDTV
jgi:hypothetical protein